MLVIHKNILYFCVVIQLKAIKMSQTINTYDYGAHRYNPVNMRWDKGDPLTEKYREISSYVYRHGNPIMLLDFDEKRLDHIKYHLILLRKVCCLFCL